MSTLTMQTDASQDGQDERRRPQVASIAIICGGGSFPGAVADAIARRGRRPVMFAVEGWADPKVVERHAHHWIAIGQVGRLFRLAHAENCREALFIGTLLRPPLTQIRLDWQTLRLMPRIARFFRGGDDRLLSGVASLFEEGGLRIIGLERCGAGNPCSRRRARPPSAVAARPTPILRAR